MKVPLSLSSHFPCAFDLIYYCKGSGKGEGKEEGKGGGEGERKGQKGKKIYSKPLGTRILSFLKKSCWPAIHRHLYLPL